MIYDCLDTDERRDWEHARKVARPGVVSSFAIRSRTMDSGDPNYFRTRVELDYQDVVEGGLANDAKIIAQTASLTVINTTKSPRLKPETDQETAKP